MARVTVQVRVHDLTRGQLDNINNRFRDLANSMNRFAGDRTQGNLTRVRANIQGLGGDLQALRGRIPESEFARLNDRFAQLRVMANSINTNTSNRNIGLLRDRLSNLNDEITRLNRNAGDGITIRPRLVPPSSGDHNRFRRALTSPFRTTGGIIGGILSDGLGQGIISGFKAAGPIAAAVLTAVIVGAISYLGAALAGILVGLIGSAFVGLGVFLALQADGVKEKWAASFKELKPIFIDAAQSMLPVIEHVRIKLVEAAKAFAPHFKDALAGAAPHVQTLFDHIMEGFSRLGETASVPLEQAFNDLINALGPMLEETLAGMGDSLAALGRTVSRHSTEIAMVINGIIGLITTCIDIINFLANTWVGMVHSGADAAGFLVQAWGMFRDFFLAAVGRIVEAYADFLDLIPGMGAKADEARAQFAKYRDGVKSDTDALAQKLFGLGETLDHTNRERHLKVNIKSLEARLAQARQDLKRTDGTKSEPRVKANIDQLKRQLATARAELNALNGKTANTYVVTHYSRTGSGLNELKYATGGVVAGAMSRAATGGIRANQVMVGEEGPEIVDLPAGSRVKSASDTRRQMGGQEGTGGTTLIFKSSGRRVDDLLLEILRESIHDRGGDPVTVLGG
jgi:hypothetical protein